MNREKQFNEFTGFSFSELDKVKYKSGCQPRNATDYYYHSASKIIYSYYFGSNNGKWAANVQINLTHVKSPSILCIDNEKSSDLKSSQNSQKLRKTKSEKIYNTADKLKNLELRFKLSGNYKLELDAEILKLENQKLDIEKQLLQLQIKLEEIKLEQIKRT